VGWLQKPSGKKMTAFLIADVKGTDAGWVPSYAAVVHDIAAGHGGRYLARSGNIERIEGAGLNTTLIALIQFPDRASLDAFIADADDAPHAAARAGAPGRRVRRRGRGLAGWGLMPDIDVRPRPAERGLRSSTFPTSRWPRWTASRAPPDLDTGFGPRAADAENDGEDGLASQRHLRDEWPA
jgi:uncharacterized protein (DUF1330 family)